MILPDGIAFNPYNGKSKLDVRNYDRTCHCISVNDQNYGYTEFDNVPGQILTRDREYQLIACDIEPISPDYLRRLWVWADSNERIESLLAHGNLLFPRIGSVKDREYIADADFSGFRLDDKQFETFMNSLMCKIKPSRAEPINLEEAWFLRHSHAKFFSMPDDPQDAPELAELDAKTEDPLLSHLHSPLIDVNKRDLATYKERELCHAYVRNVYFMRNDDMNKLCSMILWHNIKRVIVLGSGWGSFEKYARKRFKGRILSCDDSEEMIKLARKNKVKVNLSDYNTFLAKVKPVEGDMIFISHMLSLQPGIVSDCLVYPANIILYDPVFIFSGMNSMTEHPLLPGFLWCKGEVLSLRIYHTLFLSSKVIRKLNTWSRDFGFVYREKFKDRADKVLWKATTDLGLKLLNHNAMILGMKIRVLADERRIWDYFRDHIYVKCVANETEDDEIITINKTFTFNDNHFSTKIGYMGLKTVDNLEGMTLSNKFHYYTGTSKVIYCLPTVYQYEHPVRGLICVYNKQLEFPRSKGIKFKRVPFEIFGFNVEVDVHDERTFFHFKNKGMYSIALSVNKSFSTYYIKIWR